MIWKEVMKGRYEYTFMICWVSIYQDKHILYLSSDWSMILWEKAQILFVTARYDDMFGLITLSEKACQATVC